MIEDKKKSNVRTSIEPEVDVSGQHTYDFRAKNKLGRTRAIFESRKQYRDDALYINDKDRVFQGVVDLFSDEGMTMYGRLDKDLLPRYLNFNKMKPFKTSDTAEKSILSVPKIYAASFVVDAYAGFSKAFKSLMFTSHCGLGPGDYELKIKQGRVDSIQKHDMIFRQLLVKGFQTVSFRTNSDSLGKNRVDKMRTFPDMVEKFIEFVESRSSDQIPFTHTGVMFSKFAGSVDMSGLSLLLQLEDVSDDTVKTDYMNNEFFDLYRRLAMRHGFMVDRNMPWRIIADIHSPYMQKYMEPYGLTADNLFDECYSIAYNFDIQLMKERLAEMWNTLVYNRPRTRRAANGLGCGFEDRERLTKEKIAEDYDDSYWIATYIRFKNAESHTPVSGQSIRRIIKHAKELTKAFDISTTMGYINKQFQVPVYEDRLSGYKFSPKNDKVEAGDEPPAEADDPQPSRSMSAVSNY